MATTNQIISVCLDETNYHIWLFLMQHYLRGRGLLKFVNGSCPCPNQFQIADDGSLSLDDSTGAYEKWLEQDSFVISLITTTLSMDALTLVVGCRTSMEVWLTLKQRYATVSEFHIMQLKSRLHSIQKGSDSIENYLLRFKSIRDQLAVLGVQISDEDVKSLILAGLPSVYGHTRQIIRGESNFGLEEVRCLLLSAEYEIELGNTYLGRQWNSSIFAPASYNCDSYVTPYHVNYFNGMQNGYNHNKLHVLSDVDIPILGVPQSASMMSNTQAPQVCSAQNGYMPSSFTGMNQMSVNSISQVEHVPSTKTANGRFIGVSSSPVFRPTFSSSPMMNNGSQKLQTNSQNCNAVFGPQHGDDYCAGSLTHEVDDIKEYSTPSVEPYVITPVLKDSSHVAKPSPLLSQEKRERIDLRDSMSTAEFGTVHKGGIKSLKTYETGSGTKPRTSMPTPKALSASFCKQPKSSLITTQSKTSLSNTQAAKHLPIIVPHSQEALVDTQIPRAFLDYYDIPYKIVEVNPLSKKEIKFSEYKKVPILMVDGEQLVDSSDIIDQLTQKILPDRVGERVAVSTTSEDDEETKCRKWVDSHLVHMLSPNIYRNTSEALESFDYITSNGNFSYTEKITVKYAGAAAMYFVSKKLKKKYNITDERASLYEAAETWVDALNGREFLGGSKPNLADLAVFGVLRPIRYLRSGKDMVEHTRIGEWYSRMERAVGEPSRIKE